MDHRMVPPGFYARVPTFRAPPAGAGHLPPPLRSHDTPGRREVLWEKAHEDERHPVLLGPRDIPRGGHEFGELAVGHCPSGDLERVDAHGPDRPFAVVF